MALRSWLKLLLLSMAVGLYGAEKMPPPEAKVAIVFQDAKGEPVADAAMVELTGQKIICLERAEIKKVLEEQKLSASGLVNPANIVKCCRLLKVDVFAVIVCSPKNQAPVGLIVFDTRLGLRLADVSLPEKFEDQVKTTVDAVISAITKKQQLNDGKLKLVSFLPLNLIALQGKEAASARVVELVVMQLLGQNQSFLVLERSQLDFLLKERNLHPDADNQLLAGSLFIQLESELSGDKEKPLLMKLFAKDLGGKVYFSLKEAYAIDTEIKVAERMALEMGKQLGTAVVSGNFDRKAEAAKYINDSRIAKANGMYERASRMARNAYALNPEFRQELVKIEKEIAQDYLSGFEPPPESVEAAVGHAEFLLGLDDSSDDTEHQIITSMSALATIGDYYFDEKFSPQQKTRICELRKQITTMMLRRYNRQYKQINAVNSANDMQDIIKRLPVLQNIIYYSKDSNNNINSKYILPLKELYVANIDRFYTPETSLGYNNSQLFMPGIKPPKAIASRLKALYQAMQKTSVPYYKIIGTIYLYKLNKPHSYDDSSYIDFMIEVIEHDQISDQDWKYMVCFWYNEYLGHAPWKYCIKLCRSIYKKGGYDKSLFSTLYRIVNNENQAMEFYSLMKEIHADAGNDKKMTSDSRKEIINSIEQYIGKLKLSYPNLNIIVQEVPKEKKDENIQVFRRIFSVLPEIGKPDIFLSQALYDGNNIYVAGIALKERFLYKISPEQSFNIKSGEKLLIEEETDGYNNYLACFSKKYYITATTKGLFLFPLNLSAPEHVLLKEFKDFNCYAIACLNEKVYLSFERRSYERKTPLFLVEYDLRKKSYSVIYSSSQSENNPFVSRNVNYFSKMYADSIRNRLIMPVWAENGRTELWSLKLDSRNWEKLIDISYFTLEYGVRYSPFITTTDGNRLLVMGTNVVYEFDAISNLLSLKFISSNYSLPHDNFARVKSYEKWKLPRSNSQPSNIETVELEGNKLWTTYRLVFLDQKKALNLISKQGDEEFLYVYFSLKGGKFVVGSNHNCFPNNSLMAMELKSDSELLNLPECEDIAFDPKAP